MTTLSPVSTPMIKVVFQENVDATLAADFRALSVCAAQTLGVQKPTFVDVTVCDDLMIRQINQTQRSIDKATDVLSFPSTEVRPSKLLHQNPGLLTSSWDPDEEAYHLGSIVISKDTCLRQAEAFGHSFDTEARYLFIHGLMHLMGYDHQNTNDKREMREMEERILQNAVIDDATRAKLLESAYEAKGHAYAPYSHYQVGAALLCQDGSIVTGSNVENASFGLTNCAERTAVFSAMHAGKAPFIAIAIAAEGITPWPCGACRQVLNEFAPHLPVFVTMDGKTYEMATLKELLPHSFEPGDALSNDKRG